MDYEPMSNEDLNFEVFHKLSDDVWDRELSLKVWNLLAEKYDYCNNPSDAWPIIIENRITLTPYDNEKDGWFATTDTSFFVDHMNPLRAAMIVFLIMNEGKS